MELRRATGAGVKKRKADAADLNNDRLTKRLESLKLGLYLPYHIFYSLANFCSADVEAQAKDRPQLWAHIQRRPDAPAPITTASVPQATQATQQPIVDEDDMAIDETKHRVYISNLDKEIAEIEAAEAAAKKTIFIPDIDKRILEGAQRCIPLSIYANKDGELAGMNQDQALVLYDFPKSLTVDETKDSVRKAILESRKRAQDEQMRKAGLSPLESNEAEATFKPPIPTADLELDDGVEPMALEEDEGAESDVMDVD